MVAGVRAVGKLILEYKTCICCVKTSRHVKIPMGFSRVSLFVICFLSKSDCRHTSLLFFLLVFNKGIYNPLGICLPGFVESEGHAVNEEQVVPSVALLLSRMAAVPAEAFELSCTKETAICLSLRNSSKSSSDVSV